MFGIYERSFDALSGFCNLHGFYGKFSLAAMSVKRSKLHEMAVIQVKLGF